jgi:hypothetical protein
MPSACWLLRLSASLVVFRISSLRTCRHAGYREIDGVESHSLFLSISGLSFFFDALSPL